MIKSWICILLTAAMLLSLSACSTKDADVEAAVDLLRETWTERYAKITGVDSDGHFEIKNTRVIHLEDNDTEVFSNVDRVVEFTLYIDYFGTAPYYFDATFCGQAADVIIYKDGTMEVQPKVIQRYIAQTYDINVDELFEEVEDLGDAYNCVETLK